MLRDASAKTLTSENVFLDIINRDQNLKNEKDRKPVPKQQNFLMPKISSTSGLPDAYQSNPQKKAEFKVVENPAPRL